MYRRDSRPRVAANNQDIFYAGFTSRGTNADFLAHVHGDTALNGPYISTTGTLSWGEQFARSQGTVSSSHLAPDAQCSRTRRAVYALLPGFGQLLNSQNAMYIPDQIRGNETEYDYHRAQDEWASVRHIPNDTVIGVRIYEMTACFERGFLSSTPPSAPNRSWSIRIASRLVSPTTRAPTPAPTGTAPRTCTRPTRTPIPAVAARSPGAARAVDPQCRPETRPPPSACAVRAAGPAVRRKRAEHAADTGM